MLSTDILQFPLKVCFILKNSSFPTVFETAMGFNTVFSFVSISIDSGVVCVLDLLSARHKGAPSPPGGPGDSEQTPGGALDAKRLVFFWRCENDHHSLPSRNFWFSWNLNVVCSSKYIDLLLSVLTLFRTCALKVTNYRLLKR